MCAACVLVACADDDAPADSTPASETSGETSGETSAAPSGATSPDPATDDGLFVDPEGAYVMEVDPSWDFQVSGEDGVPEGVEAWFVGVPSELFAPNVNVQVEEVGPVGLELYLDASVEKAPGQLDDLTVLDQSVIELDDGRLVGRLEYTASAGELPLQFVGIVSVEDGIASVATLSATPEQIDDLLDDVEPYLLTLRSTPS